MSDRSLRGMRLGAQSMETESGVEPAKGTHGLRADSRRAEEELPAESADVATAAGGAQRQITEPEQLSERFPGFRS